MAKQLNISMAFKADTSQAMRQIKELRSSLEDLSAGKSLDKNFIATEKIREAQVAAKGLSQILKTSFNQDVGKLDLTKFNEQLKMSGLTLKDYARHLSELGAEGDQAFLKIAQSIVNTEAPLKRTNKWLSEFATTLKNTARWQISSSIIHTAVGSMERAYGYAKDLNKSLNNIRIVTGQSSEQMAKFAEQANKAAKSLSTTTTKYTDASLIYYQQGLDDEQVKERTNATIKMANVTGQDVTAVSDQLTAIWNNFEDGSKSLEYYADVITALGAATASSSEEISGGLEKFAAVAQTVGLSYEYATSALATITAKTRQSEDVVGTALKTIFARIQGLKQGDTLEDGTTLNKYSEALAKVGIDIKDTSGNLKDMDLILDEMGSKWQTLAKDQQIALAQAVGGTRQYNQVVSLMSNWDFMEENLRTARHASGELQKQADVYAESWEASKRRVKASLEEIYQSIIDDDFFIKINDLFAHGLKGIKMFIDSLGGVKGALGGIGVLLSSMYKEQIATGINDGIHNIKRLTGGSNEDVADFQKEAVNAAKVITQDSDNYGTQALQDSLKNIAHLQERLRDISDDLSPEQYEIAESALQMSKNYHEAAIEAANLYEQQQRIKDKRIDDYVDNYGTSKRGNEERAAFSEAQNRINDSVTKVKDLKQLQDDLRTVDPKDSSSKEAAIQKIREFIQDNGFVPGEKEGYARGFNGSGIAALWMDLEKYGEEGSKIDPDQILTKARTLKVSSNDIINQILDKEFSSFDINSESAKSDEIVKKRRDAVKTVLQSMLETTVASENYAEAVKGANQAQEDSNNILNNLGNKYKTLGAAIGGVGNAASSAFLASNALTSIFKTFTDDDLSTMQKLAQIISSIAVAGPAIGNVVEEFKDIKAFTLDKTQSGFTGQVASKIFGQKFLENIEKENGLTGQLTEKTELHTKAIWKQIAAKTILNAHFLAIAAAIGLVVGALTLAIKWYNKDANATKEAAKRAEEAAKSFKEAQQAYDDFKTTMSDYDKGVEGLKKLTKGTIEYKEAVLKANESALELINTNGLMSGRDYTIDNSQGLIVINEDSKKRMLEEQFKKLEEKQFLKNIASQSKKDADLKYEQTKFKREHVVKTPVEKDYSESISSPSNFGRYILEKDKTPHQKELIENIKAFNETVQETNEVVQKTDETIKISDQTQDNAIKVLQKAYADQGNSIFTEEGLRTTLKGFDAGIINSLTENVKSTEDLIVALDNNTRAQLGTAPDKIIFYNRNNRDFQSLNEKEQRLTANLIAAEAGSEVLSEEQLLEQLNKSTTGSGLHQSRINKNILAGQKELLQSYNAIVYDGKYTAKVTGGANPQYELINNTNEAESDSIQVSAEQIAKILSEQAKWTYTPQLYKSKINKLIEFRQDLAKNFSYLQEDQIEQIITALSKKEKFIDVSALTQADAQNLDKNIFNELGIDEGDWVYNKYKHQEQEKKRVEDILKQGSQDLKVDINVLRTYYEQLISNNKALNENRQLAAQVAIANYKLVNSFGKLKTALANVEKFKNNKDSTNFLNAIGAIRSIFEDSFGINPNDNFIIQNLNILKDIAENSNLALGKNVSDNITLPDEIFNLKVGDQISKEDLRRINNSLKVDNNGNLASGVFIQLLQQGITGIFSKDKNGKYQVSDLVKTFNPVEGLLKNLEDVKDKELLDFLLKFIKGDISGIHSLETLNQLLAKSQNLLAHLKKGLDSAFGMNELKQINKINEELNQQNRTLENKVSLLRIIQAEQINELENTYGFTFQNGIVQNYEKIINEKIKKVNDATTDEEKEKAQKELDKAKNAYSDFVSTQKDLIDSENQIIDNQIQRKNNLIDIYQKKLQFQIEINSDDLKVLDYEINKLDDSFYNLGERFSTIVNGTEINGDPIEGRDKKLRNEFSAVKEHYEDLQRLHENGLISDAKYFEGIAKDRDEMLRIGNELINLDREASQFYQKTLAGADKELESYLSKFDYFVSVLNHYKNIMGLVGRQTDYEGLNNIVQGQMTTTQTKLSKNRLNMNMLQREKEYINEKLKDSNLGEQERRRLESDLRAIEDMIQKTGDKILSNIEEIAKMADEIFENSLKKARKDFEEAFTGGSSLEDFMATMNRRDSIQEEYLTKTNQLYHTSNLIRKAQQDMDKTSDKVAKSKYKEYIKQVEALGKQGKLSQQELKIAQARYDLLQAQIDLENSRNNATTMRLSRNAVGGWDYIYTADEEQVNKSQQAVSDAENNLYNIGLEGAKNYQNKYYQTVSSAMNSLEDLERKHKTGIYDDEEYNKKKLELQQFYFSQLQTYSDLYYTSHDTMVENSANKEADYLFTGINSLEDFQKYTDQYLTECGNSYDTWKDNTKDALGVVGTNLGTVAGKVDAVTNASDRLGDAIGNEEEGLIADINKEIEAVKNSTKIWEGKANAIQEVIKKIGEYAGIANKDLEKAKTNEKYNKNVDYAAIIEAYLANDSNRTVNDEVVQGLLRQRARKITGEDMEAKDPRFEEINRIFLEDIKAKKHAEFGSDEDLLILIEGLRALGFDTGGYTGEWGSDGRVALLHEKELVLNKQDTANMLTAVDLIRSIGPGLFENIKEILNNNMMERYGLLNSSFAFNKLGNLKNQPSTIEQNVIVNADFPGVSAAVEIEAAINDLVNNAAQYADFN